MVDITAACMSTVLDGFLCDMQRGRRHPSADRLAGMCRGSEDQAMPSCLQCQPKARQLCRQAAMLDFLAGRVDAHTTSKTGFPGWPVYCQALLRSPQHIKQVISLPYICFAWLHSCLSTLPTHHPAQLPTQKSKIAQRALAEGACATIAVPLVDAVMVPPSRPENSKTLAVQWVLKPPQHLE